MTGGNARGKKKPTRRAARSVSPFDVAMRAPAAIVGGYALTSIAALFLSYVLPLSRTDAVIAGAIPSFAIYIAAILWSFAARSPLRAWAGLALPGAAMGVLCLLMEAGATA